MTAPDRHGPTAPAAGSSKVGMSPRVVYRSLLLRGLAPAEAANVAAFLVGLHAPGFRWTLRQVEALVALRDRAQASPDPDDRATTQLTWSRS